MLLLQRKGDYPPLEAHQHEAQKMSKTGEKTEVLFMPKTESPDLELPHLQKKSLALQKKACLGAISESNLLVAKAFCFSNLVQAEYSKISI